MLDTLEYIGSESIYMYMSDMYNGLPTVMFFLKYSLINFR